MLIEMKLEGLQQANRKQPLCAKARSAAVVCWGC